jgi:GH24 family phage-related lysozyme (muramidase)
MIQRPETRDQRPDNSMIATLQARIAQTYLQKLGFYADEVDGLWGKNSENAAAKWEEMTRPPQPVQRPPAGRQINAAGLELVKHFEGLFLKAYRCPANVWTIGYGHTGLTHKDGTVKAGRVITEAEAEDLLRHDLGKFAKRVEDGVTVPVNDDQFGALVSFDFNTGGFLKSTLRNKLNAGDFQGAADEFLKWNKAGGKVLAGLLRRRRSERNLFLGLG